MATTTELNWQGWAATNADDIVKGELKFMSYEPKTWEEDDVDIKVLYCGICASDVSAASGGWGPPAGGYPVVVGHEVIGTVVRKGERVKHLNVGDLVGLGAQCDSCMSCHYCKTDREPYCDDGEIMTLGGVFKRGELSKGQTSKGGFGDYVRTPAHFAIPIPASLDPASAASFLCGGITVYSPLKKYGAGTERKDVGVIGIGGLGHFAILLGTALGANVTAISHSPRKEADARAMGAVNFIATHTDDGSDAYAAHARSLDLIIVTSNDEKMPLTSYLSLLRPGGYLVVVGAPEVPEIPLNLFSILFSNYHVVGSVVGSPAEIREMLDLVAEKKINSWIQKRPMDNINSALLEMNAGKARYRFVLVNEKNGGVL